MSKHRKVKEMSDKIKAAISLTPATLLMLWLFGVRFIMNNGWVVLPIAIFFVTLWLGVFVSAWVMLTRKNVHA